LADLCPEQDRQEICAQSNKAVQNPQLPEKSYTGGSSKGISTWKRHAVLKGCGCMCQWLQNEKQRKRAKKENKERLRIVQ